MNDSEKDRLAYDLATEVMAWANSCPAKIVKLAGQYLELPDVIVSALSQKRNERKTRALKKMMRADFEREAKALSPRASLPRFGKPAICCTSGIAKDS